MYSDDGDIPDEIKAWMAASTEEREEWHHFVRDLCAAEFHWFFVQGVQAIRGGLYLPGLSSLLNGIEASIRVTLAQVTDQQWKHDALSPYKVLSNILIRQAGDFGIPVEFLALPGESDFAARLASEKPYRIDVEIVRLRNNICHGNVLEFINRELGNDNAFFTPECLRDVSEVVLAVSHAWAKELGVFRRRAFAQQQQ